MSEASGGPASTSLAGAASPGAATGTPPADQPTAPGSAAATGVFVLGMHGAGTSTATRAINLLGVRLANGSDPDPAAAGPLTELNDRLLFELGGSAFGPPSAEEGWSDRPELEELRAQAVANLGSDREAGPWAWGDPRNCITLPFWRAALGSRPVVVLVHREPHEMWQALAVREALSRAMAFAVWERYLRTALRSVEDLPVLVTRHATLRQAPADWGSEVAGFLRRHEVSSRTRVEWSALEVPSSSQDEEAPPGAEAGPELSEGQRQLATVLESLVGEHRSFARVDLPPETEWTEPLLSERRRTDLLRAQMQERIRAMRGRARSAQREERKAKARLERAKEEQAAKRQPGGRRRPARRVRVASRPGLLPDFLILGAQKSGTSSLYRWLAESPSVEAPTQKELHFFDLGFHRGLDWYRAQFAGLEEARAARDGGKPVLTGEASPYYLFHPVVPQRVREALPEVRLIALLRDPVHRAASHYHHEFSTGVESLPFEAALDQEEERLAGEAERLLFEPRYQSHNHRHFSYQARGVYADQLERWREFFPAEQILVVKSERLFEEPNVEMRRIYDFLGIPADTDLDFAVWNKGSYPPISAEAEARLAERFRADNQRLYELVGEDFGWSS